MAATILGFWVYEVETFRHTGQCRKAATESYLIPLGKTTYTLNPLIVSWSLSHPGRTMLIRQFPKLGMVIGS